MSTGQRRPIPINERADDMLDYLESNDDISYSDFSSEFDDYIAYLAVDRGPSSNIDEDKGLVTLSEADLAIASHFGRKVEEAESIDVWKMLEAGSETGVTAAFTFQFFSTGDPEWLTPAAVLGYLSKEDLEEAYEDLRDSYKTRKQKKDSLGDFEDEYPDLDSYELDLVDLDDLDIPISSVRPENLHEDMSEVIDSDRGFQ